MSVYKGTNPLFYTGFKRFDINRRWVSYCKMPRTHCFRRNPARYVSDQSVGTIVTELQVAVCGGSNPGGVGDHPNRFLGPHTLIFNACRVSIPTEEYTCRGMNLTTPSSSIEVTNEWSYTSTPSLRLHGVDRGTCILSLEDKATWFASMTNERRKCLQNVKERVSCYAVRRRLGRT
jgi:hypothetical protein